MSLVLSGATHAYRGGSVVLRDIDFVLHDGEMTAIMGPSGSGKTTLLTLLGLLQVPTAGTVSIDGAGVPRAETARSRLRRELFGWIFQTVNVLGKRSTLDNVALALVVKGHPRSEAETMAESALAQVDLLDHAAQPAEDLSGGELQRICIARALAVRPRFLLADEPTGQLDQTNSVRVMEAMISLREPSTSLLVATHDRRVASHCDRVVELADGRIK